VLDLGAAPGGWTQVAVKRGAASVLAVDLLPIDPIHGATIIQGDFSDPDMPARLAGELGGSVNLILSDMAPNTTGHAATEKQILDILKRNFSSVRHAKPPSSRKESSELYVVATGFKGRAAII